MKTTKIIEDIYSEFATTYRVASNFVDSGELWNFCIETIKDPVNMTFIISENNKGVPPVKSLLTFYSESKNPTNDFTFTAQESQNMGALMGYVFKFVFGYQDQKEGCKVEFLGVKTATKFLDGRDITLEA